MFVVQSYPDNVFSWVDLSTIDVEAAKKFYGGLFGWEFDDRPTDQGTLYTMCLIDGNFVAGMGPLSSEMLAQGAPAFWTSYVNHRQADAVAAKVTEAGGSLMFPPMDVMEEGRMFIAVDPSGAVFGVWQPKNHTGAQVVNYPNALVWNELQTPDTEAARGFYKSVFDWEYSVDENDYVLCIADGRRQAGMMSLSNVMEGVPPNWAVYFLLADAEATAKKAQELGGMLLVEPREIGMGKLVVVQDPQGGVFSAMEFSGEPDPPPGAGA